MKEKCSTKYCRGEVALTYLGKSLCQDCYEKLDEKERMSMKNEKKRTDKNIDAGEVVKKTAKEMLDENAEKKINQKKREYPKPEVTAEDFISQLKPLGITTKEDKTGNIGLILDRAITYIQRRKYGMSYQILKRVNGNLNWYQSGKVVTKKELTEKIELIKEYIKNKNPETLVKLGFLEIGAEKTPMKPKKRIAKKSVKPKSKKSLKNSKIENKQIISKLQSRIDDLGNGSKGINVSNYPITDTVKSWIDDSGYTLDGSTLLVNHN